MGFFLGFVGSLFCRKIQGKIVAIPLGSEPVVQNFNSPLRLSVAAFAPKESMALMPRKDVSIPFALCQLVMPNVLGPVPVLK